MAGKVYTSYQNQLATAPQPAKNRVRAYAEGYLAAGRAALQTTNPHPAWQNTDSESDWWAWDRGWLDKTAAYPAGHCA
jgi:hypothetical protein